MVVLLMDSTNKIKIGDIIRTARKRKKFTQEQLAELVDVTGGFLGQIERDISYPSFETLVNLIYVLDINPEMIFYPSTDELLKDYDIELLDNEIRLNLSLLNKRNKETILYLAKRLIELQSTNLPQKESNE